MRWSCCPRFGVSHRSLKNLRSLPLESQNFQILSLSLVDQHGFNLQVKQNPHLLLRCIQLKQETEVSVVLREPASVFSIAQRKDSLYPTPWQSDLHFCNLIYTFANWSTPSQSELHHCSLLLDSNRTGQLPLQDLNRSHFWSGFSFSVSFEPFTVHWSGHMVSDVSTLHFRCAEHVFPVYVWFVVRGFRGGYGGGGKRY